MVVPPGVVTVTSTVPLPAGETAAIEVSEITSKLVAGVEPNEDRARVLRFVPVIVTVVPPPSGPSDGLTLATVGGSCGSAAKVRSSPWLVPLAFVATIR